MKRSFWKRRLLSFALGASLHRAWNAGGGLDVEKSARLHEEQRHLLRLSERKRKGARVLGAPHGSRSSCPHLALFRMRHFCLGKPL